MRAKKRGVVSGSAARDKIAERQKPEKLCGRTAFHGVLLPFFGKNGAFAVGGIVHDAAKCKT